MLYDLVGYTGMSQAAKDIMEGTFLEKHGDLDILPETEQLIKELAMPEEIKVLGNKVECKITEDNFRGGFKAWKESTSMSPSSCHLGHYKAIINDPEMKKKEPTECNHDIDFVATFTSKALNIPLRHGFVPKQWCKSITVMIEKDPGNPRIEQLHVIHLFEADYNFCLTQLWGR